MRGSSDLESVWESRLAFKRDGEIVTVTSEHREAEPGDPLAFRLAWHHETRTMRLRTTVPPLGERTLDYLREHGPSGAETIAKGNETRRSDVDRTLAQLETLGTTHRAPSGKRDAIGRPIPAKVWHRTVQAELCRRSSSSADLRRRRLDRRAIEPHAGEVELSRSEYIRLSWCAHYAEAWYRGKLFEPTAERLFMGAMRGDCPPHPAEPGGWDR